MKYTFTLVFISLLFGLLLIPQRTFGQGAPSIMFFIHNPQVNGNTYSFDIYAVVSRIGTYHSRGHVYLNYNSLAFGSSVAANNRVTVTPLMLLNEVIPNVGPKYSTVNIHDNTSSRVAVSWTSNFLFATPGPLAHTEMRTTPTALYHIEMEILNPNATLAVSLNGPLMTFEQFYFKRQGIEALYSMTPFPVTWGELTANPYSGGTEISWQTQSEVNSAFFEVEKQVDGGEFVSIHKLDAAGYSDEPLSYTITDQEKSTGKIYYRIKQTDQDGLSTYSSVVALQEIEVDALQVKGYPNPVKDVLKLDIKNPQSDWVEIQIRNIQGQLVETRRMWVEGKQNNHFSLELKGMEAGCYFLQTLEEKSNYRSNIFKFMKF